MSGIAAALGRSPAEREGMVRRMLAAMAHRGPDGLCQAPAGAAHLGHALLETEAAGSSAGLLFAEGGWAVAADARLDDASGLARVLGLDPLLSAPPALILAAYCRWGEDCLQHLSGDFAFVLWDPQRSVLFGARDHFGVKPFSYHSGPDLLLIASEPGALLSVPDVPRRIDEASLAGFLASHPVDPQSTTFAAVRRLPPAHLLLATPDGVTVRRYWRMEPQPAVAGEDIALRFQALFRQAVARRLPRSGTAGIMLSGGLDSSSIACMARDIGGLPAGCAPRTLSMVFDENPALDERAYIEPVLGGGGFRPIFVPGDGHAPFAGIAELLDEQQEPFFAPALALTRSLRTRAAAEGVRVLLDGHGGDEVVSYGFSRLDELARARSWLSLWQASRGVSTLHAGSALRLFSTYAMAYGPGRHVRRARRLVRRLTGMQGAPASAAQLPVPVSEDFARRTGLADSLAREQARPRPRDEAEEHLALLGSDLMSRAFDVLDRTSAACGIEARYPFWDRDLVAFCLSVPASAKLEGPWTRAVLRRAMEGILPAKVQWRTDKVNFGPHLAAGMARRDRDLLDSLILRDRAGIAAYVNLPAVRAAYARLCADPERAPGQDVHTVWRTALFALWFEREQALSRADP